VNTEKFASGQQAYDAGDWRSAWHAFLEATEKGTPIGNGPAYHMAGNALLQLKRYSDAAVVFEHALRDDTYARRGAVEANLANAYLRLGDYSGAVAHYEAALSDSEPHCHYRYYLGIAQAFLKQEDYQQAALAYKHAALDEYNPNPGKALMNLGLVLMAGGNAKAAAEAYRAAIGSAGFTDKGRATLNLGIALHAQGKWRDAIRTLEEAQMLHGYADNDLAARTIADARQRQLIEDQVRAADETLAAGELDVADDIVAGEIPVVPPTDVPATAIPDVSVAAAEDAPPAADATQPDETKPVFGAPPARRRDDADRSPWSGVSLDEHAGDTGSRGDVLPLDDAGSSDVFDTDNTGVIQVRDADVEQYFGRTEREIAAEGRRRARETRKPLAWAKPLGIVLLVLAVMLGAGTALYMTGQGIPSPKTTVTDLMEAYNAGKDIAPMWLYDANDITRQMVVIPTSPDYTITEVTSGAATSTAQVSVQTTDGAAMDFTFELAREGIGWKIASVTANY
jgi:tetratricopeptide (TPR) repeat protein